MLNCKPANLWLEYQAAKRYRDEHLRSLPQRVKRYVGPAYKGEPVDGRDYEPENHEFEYLSLTVPKIVYDNPRVRVVSQRQGTQRDVAIALQSGLNRWIRDVNLRRQLSRLCVDMLLGYGCAMVVMDEDKQAQLPDRVMELRKALMQSTNPADIGPVYRPKVHRISPNRMFWDPLALDISEARFLGHEWVQDKDDLLLRARQNPDEGWDYAAISGLPEDQGVDDLRRKQRQEGGTVNTPTRKEVVGIDVWVPGYQLEDQPGSSEGYNGAIFTLVAGGESSGAVEIRKPRMAYVPPWGPYAFFGAYYVPDQTAPLAPTVAIHTQVQTLNLHAQAVASAAGRRKKLAFVSKSDKSVQKAVKEARDGDVIPVNTEELNNNLKEVELGGVTPAALQGLQIERERRDRISGMSDAMRGNVSGSGTATENAIADEAGSTRLAFLKQQFSDSTSQMLRTVAWYLFSDDRVAYPLGDEAHQAGLPEGTDAGAPPEPWFHGGIGMDGSGATFQDLDLEIEAYSMERTSESVQQKRMMEMVQILTQVIPAAMQGPVNIKPLVDMLGDMGNLPELGKIINLQMANMQQQMMFQGMMQQMMQPTPTLGGDAGLGPKPTGVSPPGGSQPMPMGMGGIKPAPASGGGSIGQRAGANAKQRVLSNHQN